MIVSVALRIYLTFVNKSRDKVEGAGAVQEPTTPGKVELTALDYEDVTDFHTPGFRYRM